MAVRLAGGTVTLRQAGIDDLSRGPLSPIGRDIYARGLRVTKRMKELASGVDGGPQIRSRNLYSSIRFISLGGQGDDLIAKIGVSGTNMIRRRWNYAYILEGPRSSADPRIRIMGGHDFGFGARRPFMAKALEAAA